VNQIASDWMTYLHTAEAAIALPLMVAGALLMMFGWRLWRLVVALAYLLVAGLGVYELAGDSLWQGSGALAAGLLAGGAAWYLRQYAVAGFGALAGAALMMHFAQLFGMQGPGSYVAAGLGGVAGWGLSILNLRQVTVFLTATLGAMLLMSGLTVLAHAAPSVLRLVTDMTGNSPLLGVFVVLVPAVVSCFYQLSEAHCTAAENLAQHKPQSDA